MRLKGIKALPVMTDDDLDFVALHPGIDATVAAAPPREINQDIFIVAGTVGFDKNRSRRRSGRAQWYPWALAKRGKHQQKRRYMPANAG